MISRRRDRTDVVDALQGAPQIAVGDDADQLTSGVDDTR